VSYNVHRVKQCSTPCHTMYTVSNNVVHRVIQCTLCYAMHTVTYNVHLVIQCSTPCHTMYTVSNNVVHRVIQCSLSFAMYTELCNVVHRVIPHIGKNISLLKSPCIHRMYMVMYSSTYRTCVPDLGQLTQTFLWWKQGSGPS